MAVDVCSEVSSLVVSPRISFSHDLREADPVECRHIRSDALLLESIDFNFCISQSFSQELLSSADELFANGKILPAEVKKSTAAEVKPQKKEEPSSMFQENLRSKPISPRFRKDTALKTPKTEHNAAAEAPLNFDTKKKSLKEFLSLNLDSDAEAEDQEKKPAPTKPFWQFRRSSSLNFDTCRSNTLIRSLHFLSRSNSTGSAPNPKSSSSSSSSSSSAMPKVMAKQLSQRDQPSSAKRTKSSLPSSTTNQNHHFHHSNSSSYRSPSRKNYGNGVRISPVLNIPHACISKGTVSLFGLGSLFCNGKSKKKKKYNY